MAKLQELIQKGKLQGPAARNLVRDIPLTSVTDAHSEIRTRHLTDGQTHRYTVLTFTLDGSELLATDQADIEPYCKDAATPTTPPPQSRSSQRNLSAEVFDKKLAAFKKGLEKKANNALEKQLIEHNTAHDKRVQKSYQNYEKLVKKSLTSVRTHGTDLEHGHVNLNVPDKLAAKILANSPKVFAEYQKACEESLKEYRADLKRQYRQHLNDIELECRNCIKANAGSSLKIGVLNGLTNTITRATSFVAPLPIIDKSVSNRFTEDMLAAEVEESFAEFRELASKPVEEGGLGFAREDIELEPLFEDTTEPDHGEGFSMMEAPATSLPMYKETSRRSKWQASPALSIIDRNNVARAGQSAATHVFGTPAFRTGGVQGGGAATSGGNFDSQFTAINRPYTSPYPALTPNHPGPALIPSSNWYSSTDKSLLRPPSSTTNANLGTQDSEVGYRSRIITIKGANKEQIPSYPSYPMLEPKANVTSNTLPRAGVFKHPTVTQPAPRRVAPTLVAPIRQFEGDLNNEDDEVPRIRWPPSPVIQSNSIPAPRRSGSTIEYSNPFVDTGLYDADYEEEDDKDYVPPPAVPDWHRPQQQSSQTPRNRSTHSQSARFDPNTYVDESLYDEDYVPPSVLATPQQSQPSQYFKTEPQDIQPRHRMTSLRSYSPPTPQSPFLNDTQNLNLERGSVDQPDYEQYDNSELPSYQDFDEEEVGTSRYLAGASAYGTGRGDAISFSSDNNDEDGDADEEDEDDYNPERAFEDGNAYRDNGVPYGPNSTYQAPRFEFGAHIDPHASERDVRPLFTSSRSQDQSQQANLKRKRERSPWPDYDAISAYAGSENSWDAGGQRVDFQQRFRGKTVAQVMKMLKVGEMKRQKDVEGGDGAGGEERAAKRVRQGASVES